MRVPFITKRSELSRRKGGGGGGHGGGGRGGGGKSSSSSSSGKGSAAAGSSTSVTVGGKGTKTATPYSFGGGHVSTIPSGNFFAGRSVGGGNRTSVYGTRSYGSGYPGVSGRGVSGRGFPFYFWPLAWGGAAAVAGTAAYLHLDEYGRYDNASRPGGVMTVAEIASSTAQGAGLYRLVADNTTVSSLVPDIIKACSSSGLGNANEIHIVNYTDPSSNTSDGVPRPEQVVQYFRASSVALTLDGYNNSATLGDESLPDSPLPPQADLALLACLNNTIGQAVPLVDGSPRTTVHPLMMLFVLFAVLALQEH